MRSLLVFVFGIFVFVGDVWAPPPAGSVDQEAEERWDEYGTNDDGTWWGITGGVRYEGVTICAAEQGVYLEKQNDIDLTPGNMCWCKITSPFDGAYVFFAGYYHSGVVSCGVNCSCGGEEVMGPQGIGVSADEIMQLHNALLNSQKKKLAACYLKTSTGVSLPLYDVKSTSPALHVLRDGVLYYGNMELGRGTNTLNVNYNGAIYHLVE